MSHWSITEHTDHRLIAQTIPRQTNASWAIRILQAAVIISAYCPGIASLIAGSAVLPATAVCTVSKTAPDTMDCQVSRNLWGRVIWRQTEQLAEAPAPRLELQSPGDPSLFYFGLCWLAGVTGTIGATKILRVRKTNWIFDNSTGTIQKQSISLLPRHLQTFDLASIQSLYLEIPDIDLEFLPMHISLCLQIQAEEIIDRYTLWNKLRPKIYAAPHQELLEILHSIIQPIGAFAALPWQLAFWHQGEDGEEYYIFDFVARSVTQYRQGEQILHLDFAEISSFEVEEPSNSDYLELELIRPERPTMRYLNLIVGEGIRLQIHRYAGFSDVATAKIWFHQLEAAFQPYFPEMVAEIKEEPDCVEWGEFDRMRA
jgi:hypothetical protein